jgi:hypothetical protein
MNPISEALRQDAPLPLLAREVRRLDGLLRENIRSALRIALDEGKLLTWLKARIGRSWIAWRSEHLPEISKRTDEVYRRLSAYRTLIDQELEDNPDLSIREALRVISPPKPKAPKPPALEHWRALDASGKAVGLERDGLDKFLEYMPAAWRETLTDRLSTLSTRSTAVVNTDKTLDLAKGALALLKNKTPDNIENARRKLSLIINRHKTAVAEEPVATIH